MKKERKVSKKFTWFSRKLHDDRATRETEQISYSMRVVNIFFSFDIMKKKDKTVT